MCISYIYIFDETDLVQIFPELLLKCQIFPFLPQFRFLFNFMNSPENIQLFQIFCSILFIEDIEKILSNNYDEAVDSVH